MEMRSNKNIRIGDVLQELGYISKITGYYGTETIEALKNFQDRNNLAVDGKAGEETFNLIYFI